MATSRNRRHAAAKRQVADVDVGHEIYRLADGYRGRRWLFSDSTDSRDFQSTKFQKWKVDFQK
jgi:hypothetical protein